MRNSKCVQPTDGSSSNLRIKVPLLAIQMPNSLLNRAPQIGPILRKQMAKAAEPTPSDAEPQDPVMT